jgi:predicted RNase H-like HicB family nuclease
MKQDNNKITITLTGVVVQDQSTKGFTAYMLELPEVIAEGNTEQEVEEALFDNLKTVLEFRREDFENEIKGKDNYSTKSFELELA